MKKTNGFTIAEILITLGIIGVVAAITLPSLYEDSKRQTYANSLAVAVSDFETAMKNMIERENVNTLRETPAWIKCKETMDASTSDNDRNQFYNDISNYLDLVRFSSRDNFVYHSLYRPNLNAAPPSGIRIYSKKGFKYVIFIHPNYRNSDLTENDGLARGTGYIEQAASVNIDVNGDDLPNTYGRDFFCFDLSNDGTLYPVGGRDYFRYNQGRATGIVPCTDQNGMGRSCAAHLMSNGYKMDY